ncbi:ATP-grasp domain-containing protein [Flagellimonas sp.]|uniref:ATP-grasp domain-containing protein n=1 Tax=Flagellimonas sp. TaxID=2058762 RepID=UPI003B597552
MNYDVVILTDPRYVNPQERNPSIENVLLEDQLVLDALKQLELNVTRKSWDDPDFDWTTTKYAIFRSTWDCFNRFSEFSNWLNHVSSKTKLINSKELINWNIDKHYMKDLAANGIAIPKTLFIEQGQKTTLSDTYREAIENYGFNKTAMVLKPCISGGARHTYKILPSETTQYEELFQELIANEAMMLQEFQHNIVTKGEISMMVFNGKFTNAVLKIAKQGDFRVQDDFGGSVQEYNPTQEEISFAEKTAMAAPEIPIYARVDIFRDNDGNLALAELEIFEPELWFRLFPEAANILATSIKKRLF